MDELFRRFEVKDEKNLDKFKDLVEEKNLSREDLILILETISLTEDVYLARDVEELIIETDEKDPKVIARINELLCPNEGYRVRVKFNYTDFNNRLKTLESKVNLLESKASKSTR